MFKFTKLFCTAFLLLAGFVGASAQDETFDLTADMFYTWNGYGADAVSMGAATVDFQLGVTLGGGGVVCGTSTVDHLTYADLTGCSKMLFEGTAGLALRVLMNRQESNSGPLTEKNPTIGDDGTAELDLTELPYVHLNAIKVNWGGNGSVTAIKLVKPSDPLAIYKEQLKNSIGMAKLQSPFAKTDDSWNALQSAIADAEAVLAAATDAASLEAARSAVDAAVSGLTLQEGYSDLTADMFKKYASVDEPGEPQTAYPAYQLFTASDLPYGDGNVGELNWADLTEYTKLVVTTTGDTKPRFCLNRLVANGQQAATMEDSKMLDINPNNDFTWSTEKYLTAEDGVYTLDLAAIVADYGFARLHCIKKQGWGAGVIITGMYLYSSTENPVQDVKDKLAKAIELAKLFGADTTAGEALLANPDATAEQLEAALQAIVEAAKPKAEEMLTLIKAFFAKFDNVAGAALAPYFTAAEEALAGTDFDAMYDAAMALFAQGLVQGESAMTKVNSYLSKMGDETVDADLAALSAAIASNDMQDIVDALRQLKDDLPDAASAYALKVNALISEGKAAGNDVSAMQAALNNVMSVALEYKTTGTKDLVDVGYALYELIKAVEDYNATTTGISFVNADVQNAVIYNLKGEKVLKTQKGLYIVNGKKMILK